MRSFAVDRNNDLFIGANGHMAVNIRPAAVMQTCEHVMQSLLGEVAFSTHRGLPYMETVWNGNPKLRLFEAASRKVLSAVRDVVAVRAFRCEVADNTLRYWASVESVYGTFEIGGKEVKRAG